MVRLHNYLSVVSPYMWSLFRRNDGVPPGSGDDLFTYTNYFICAPEMAFAQREDEDDPLTYCAFVMIADRTQLQSAFNSTTAINGSFFEGDFFPFEVVDRGISFLLLNSMYRDAGALTTTALKTIQYAALIGLSPDAGEAMHVAGTCWDMFLETRYRPLDTLAFAPNGKLIIAYRSQEEPCEATLWLALN